MAARDQPICPGAQICLQGWLLPAAVAGTARGLLPVPTQQLARPFWQTAHIVEALVFRLFYCIYLADCSGGDSLLFNKRHLKIIPLKEQYGR